MQKCWTCRKEITNADVYPSLRSRKNPNCIECTKSWSRAAYHKKKAVSREFSQEAPDQLIRHNINALKAILAQPESEPKVFPIKLVGCPFPIPDGLKVISMSGRVILRVVVSAKLSINRDMSTNTISQVSVVFAKNRIKVLHGK